MSTKILSGYSALRARSFFPSSERAEISEKNSPDFGWICARHLTEAGTLLSGHALGKSECFSLKMCLVICRSFGSVVCSCNIAAVLGPCLDCNILAE